MTTRRTRSKNIHTDLVRELRQRRSDGYGVLELADHFGLSASRSLTSSTGVLTRTSAISTTPQLCRLFRRASNVALAASVGQGPVATCPRGSAETATCLPLC